MQNGALAAADRLHSALCSRRFNKFFLTLSLVVVSALQHENPFYADVAPARSTLANNYYYYTHYNYSLNFNLQNTYVVMRICWRFMYSQQDCDVISHANSQRLLVYMKWIGAFQLPGTTLCMRREKRRALIEPKLLCAIGAFKGREV